MAQAGMGLPTYAYAANNPVRYVDPTGLEIWFDASDPLMAQAVTEYRSTRAGEALWSELDARPEVVWLTELEPSVDFDDGPANFSLGETDTPPDGSGISCQVVLEPSLNRRYRTSAASSIGHELTHAKRRLDRRKRLPAMNEVLPTIHEMFFELQRRGVMP
jgi:uncharacterized protein RhaS with RHS repeats